MADTAHEAAVVAVRAWIDRHPRGPAPDWSDWAARNLLADPEVRHHLRLAAEPLELEDDRCEVCGQTAVRTPTTPWQHARRDVAHPVMIKDRMEDWKW